MPRQIQGSQTDFSFGEVDVDLKRADSHPARKAGLRQMANARIKNSGGFQNRSGRRALFPISNGCTRIEEFTISPGNIFKIAFGPARLQIINSAGTIVANFSVQGGSGAALPWIAANLRNVVYALFGRSIYLTFPGMRPQVVTWDGVATWTIAAYTEVSVSGQLRTYFYRLAPAGAIMLPDGLSGGIMVTIDQPWFNVGHIGTRMRFCGRQILITGVTTPQLASATVEEVLPGSQQVGFGAGVDPSKLFSVGDVVEGSVSGAKAYMSVVNAGAGATVGVQLLNSTSNVTAPSPGTVALPTAAAAQVQQTSAFVVDEIMVGPAGSAVVTVPSAVGNPDPAPVWDEQVMDAFHGFPASCFTDQFRVGFCNFPAVPGGIGWSAINSPTDLYVGATPDSAMFEIAPAKTQVYYVVPGPEGSEFVFCDNRIFYIPISETNPLRPGSVAFKIVSGDGAAQVQPRLAQELILYANAGQSSMMAIIATGAQQRPFATKNLSDYHAHLFNNIVSIAAPNADGSFGERYAYVLNGDGSIAVGKYSPDSLQTNIPVIGWGPWSGAGVITWLSAWNADVIFSSNYLGAAICEVLDDSHYLDAALPVNALPAVFAPPAGKGPLWFLLPGLTTTLIDQGTRFMGTYEIDGNGFIVPQNNGGEDLTLASLVAGQPWTMTAEPFAPDAQSGADMGQRMGMRQFSNFAVYVLNSTGFMFASLFSAKQTPTSPPLGTVTRTHRVPAWNTGDDATRPPTQRETVESWPPPGSSFDPRCAIIKDTPGPLTVLEIAMEISL